MGWTDWLNAGAALLGGFAGSQGSGNQNVTTSNVPWEPLHPFMIGGTDPQGNMISPGILPWANQYAMNDQLNQDAFGSQPGEHTQLGRARALNYANALPGMLQPYQQSMQGSLNNDFQSLQAPFNYNTAVGMGQQQNQNLQNPFQNTVNQGMMSGRGVNLTDPTTAMARGGMAANPSQGLGANASIASGLQAQPGAGLPVDATIGGAMRSSRGAGLNAPVNQSLAGGLGSAYGGGPLAQNAGSAVSQSLGTGTGQGLGTPAAATALAGMGSGRGDFTAPYANRAIANSLSPSRLTPDDNPALQSYMEAATRPLTQALEFGQVPEIRRGAIGMSDGGTTTRAGIAEGLARGLTQQAIGDTRGRIASNAYGQGLQNQAQMAGLANQQYGQGVQERVASTGQATQLLGQGTQERLQAAQLANQMYGTGVQERQGAAGLANQVAGQGIQERLGGMSLANQRLGQGIQERLGSGGLATTLSGQGIQERQGAANVANQMYGQGTQERLGSQALANQAIGQGMNQQLGMMNMGISGLGMGAQELARAQAMYPQMLQAGMMPANTTLDIGAQIQQERDYNQMQPFRGLDWLSGITAPYATGLNAGTSTQQMSGGNPWLGGIGGALQGLSLADQLGGLFGGGP